MKLKFILIFLFLYSLLTAQVINKLPEFKKYLDEKEAAYEKISSNYGIATWNLYSAEGEVDLISPKKEYAKLFAEKQLNENLKYWKDKVNNDQILKRRIELWNTMVTASKIDLDSEIAETSAKLLQDINNRSNKDLAMAAQLQNRVLDLMKLRNKKAKQFGYSNYADFLLDYSGVGYKWYDNFVNEVDKRTAPVYRELLDKIKSEKGSVSVRELFPYFINRMDPKYSTDSLYILMKETVGNIGFDFEKLPIRFVVREADFGGNCIGVNIPDDFRVIMVPNMPISVYLHELGHGLQWMKTSVNYPILEGYEWNLGHGGTPFYEGMAEVLANFCREPLWYKKYSKLTDEQIKDRTTVDKYAMAFTLRFTLFNFLTEVEIYRNPDADPSEIYAELYARFLMLEEPPFRKLSLVNTMYVDYPCYLHNYMMADVIGWQVHQALKREFGEEYIFNKNTGKFLVDKLYKDGVLYDWKELLLKATGSEFDLDGYLKSMGM